MHCKAHFSLFKINSRLDIPQQNHNFYSTPQYNRKLFGLPRFYAQKAPRFLSDDDIELARQVVKEQKPQNYMHYEEDDPNMTYQELLKQLSSSVEVEKDFQDGTITASGPLPISRERFEEGDEDHHVEGFINRTEMFQLYSLRKQDPTKWTAKTLAEKFGVDEELLANVLEFNHVPEIEDPESYATKAEKKFSGQ
eukprot:TRINITY_DN15707_c0_g1_i1.p1 TRINITY_DN15707_c0_g1~~TRINITY_DN15707_c0_g1_i1.p1  ORF type:complete len:195 (-),score=40.57 TRINITY_DN15707_c0_g1_i1:16-600(-)